MIEKEIDQKKVVKVISGKWKNWKDARRGKEAIWDDCIKHYMTHIDESDYESWPWRCKVSRPVAQEVGDTISAAVKSALFPDNEDFFDIEGLDDIGNAFKHDVKEYLKTVLFKMRFVHGMGPFIKQLIVTGNSHAGLPWRKEGIIRKRWQDGVVVPHNHVTWDSTKLEVHDIFDVVFDPREPTYTQGSTRIRRKIVNVDELKLKSDFYSNLKNLSGGKTPSEESDSNKEIRRSLYGINEGITDKTKDVELLILNGDINIDGKIYHDRLAVVANRKHLLTMIPNPFWCGSPNIFSNYSGFVNEALGRGAIEPIAGLQKLIDTFSCQKADIANLTINGFWAYRNDGIIDPENLISKPFGMVECEDVNNIKSLVPSSNPTLAFNEIEDLRLEAERSSGASKFAQGAVMPGRRTATEVANISAGTSTRLNDITLNIGDAAIEPALNMILQQQFQYNYGSPLLDQMAWEGMYKVTFNGAKNSAVRETAIQAFGQFTQIIGQNPMFAQFTNPGEFITEWQKLLNIKNDNLVRQEPLTNEFPELDENRGEEVGQGASG